jgi:hypothetical protein
MSIFTVHMPRQRTTQSAPDPERFVFVRDGFSFWAFLLGPLWMLWHGLWLAFLGYAVLAAALATGLQAIGASTQVAAVTAVLFALLIGLEASTVRRLGLPRRRWEHVGVVVGDRLESAERRFFHAWKERDSSTAPFSVAASPPPPAQASAGAAPASDIIGLFPQPGGWR